VARLFADLAALWWLAGGYALELAVGRTWREHGDIDVLLLRRDQLAVQRALSGWEWWAADPPGTLRPWRAGEILPPSVHDIWCRPGHGTPWRIQVMLDESIGGDWVSRRNPAVRRPITTLGHKSKGLRPKDERDFAEVLPVLNAEQRDWLRTAIARTYGDHPWHRRMV
jgi:hypothetical protein